MKLIFFILFFFCTSLLYSQSWSLVYYNDKDGKRLEGNIEDLKKAVQSGKEIRIGWSSQHPEIKKIRVEHVTDAAFLTIQSDSIIHAQIRPITGQTPDFGSGTITLKENLEWLFIGGTNGKMDRMMRNAITGEIFSHVLEQKEFKWFVKE